MTEQRNSLFNRWNWNSCVSAEQGNSRSELGATSCTTDRNELRMDHILNCTIIPKDEKSIKSGFHQDLKILFFKIYR
jgi:hypothetical protein